MISANDLMHRSLRLKRYLYRDPQEGSLCFQISGHCPEQVAAATDIVTQAGADLIDLNCGCPVRKIRKKAAGSKVLQDPERLYQLVGAMKANTNKPVTVKIRVSSPVDDHNTSSVIEAVESAGVDAIVVHGRHWTERYDVPCSIKAIREIVRQAHVPVIANGDVLDIASLQTLFKKTHCDGVMISRASVGNPWLFRQLQQAMQPKLVDVGAAFLEHIEGLRVLGGERAAVLQSRKLAKYYAQHLPIDKKHFIVKAQQKDQLGELRTLVTHYFC